MNNVEKTELTATEKLAQFEKEKLTRRQALKRFGFQAGAAAVAALTADDLLRKVGREMQRRAGDNKVAHQVATELSNTGVAFADAIPIDEVPVMVCFGSGGQCTLPCFSSPGYSCEPCGGWCYNYLYLAPRNCSTLSLANCSQCCLDQLNKCTASGSTCQLAYLDCKAKCN